MYKIALIVCGVVAACALFYAALPGVIQPIVRVLLWPRYRFRVFGRENLPLEGPVLLVVNHMTWLDGFFLAAVCPRRGVCLVNAAYLALPVIGSLARRSGLIPVPATGPKGQRAAIQAARASLDRGEVLGIFPEAQISRNGLPGKFYRGLELILSGREHVPVVPIFLDNLWGSLFSFSDGRFLRKGPRGLRRTVCIAFGPPLAAPVTVYSVRQALLEAGARAFALRGGQDRALVLETLDPALPRLEHPELGLLAASTSDYHAGDVHQIGNKPGTVGHPVPGVALRVVDSSSACLPPDTPGNLQALVPQYSRWVDTGWRGRIDVDGFVTLEQ